MKCQNKSGHCWTCDAKVSRKWFEEATLRTSRNGPEMVARYYCYDCGRQRRAARRAENRLARQPLGLPPRPHNTRTVAGRLRQAAERYRLGQWNMPAGNPPPPSADPLVTREWAAQMYQLEEVYRQRMQVAQTANPVIQDIRDIPNPEAQQQVADPTPPGMWAESAMLRELDRRGYVRHVSNPRPAPIWLGWERPERLDIQSGDNVPCQEDTHDLRDDGETSDE